MGIPADCGDATKVNDMELLKRRMVEHSDNGHRFVSTIKYGFWHPGPRSAQAPHFTLTVDTYERMPGGKLREASFGCQHDLAARIAPDLSPLIRWHLCDDDGDPMHGIENAVYWAQKATDTELCLGHIPERRSYDPDPIEAFKSTAIFGAVEGDTMPDLTLDDPVLVDSHGMPEMCDRGTIGYARANGPVIRGRVVKWCEDRLLALRAAFEQDMARFELTGLRNELRKMLQAAKDSTP